MAGKFIVQAQSRHIPLFSTDGGGAVQVPLFVSFMLRGKDNPVGTDILREDKPTKSFLLSLLANAESGNIGGEFPASSPEILRWAGNTVGWCSGFLRPRLPESRALEQFLRSGIRAERTGSAWVCARPGARAPRGERFTAHRQVLTPAAMHLW